MNQIQRTDIDCHFAHFDSRLGAGERKGHFLVFVRSADRESDFNSLDGEVKEILEQNFKGNYLTIFRM